MPDLQANALFFRELDRVLSGGTTGNEFWYHHPAPYVKCAESLGLKVGLFFPFDIGQDHDVHGVMRLTEQLADYMFNCELWLVCRGDRTLSKPESGTHLSRGVEWNEGDARKQLRRVVAVVVE
jgi:hypothetical protein